MNDLDARVAALKMALEYISWHAFGECRIGLGPIPEARDVVAAIRAELQKPALHEPCTQQEAAKVMAYLHFNGIPDISMKSIRAAVDAVLQGRAQPAATKPQLIDCGECRTQGCVAGQCRNAPAETAQEEITDGEMLNWLECWKDGYANIDRITSANKRFNGLPNLRDAIKASIRASKGEKT